MPFLELPRGTFRSQPVPTRRIAAAAVLMAAALAATGCVDKKKEIDEQTILLQQAASGGVASQLRPGDPMPRSREARALWVTRRGLGSLKHLADSVSAQYGVDVNKPPAAFGTQEYYGNAAKHPEVRRYFAQYALYAADMREHAFEWVRGRLREDVRQTSLTGPFERGMLSAYDAKIEPFKHAMRTAGNGATEMVAFHDYLVSLGGRVRYDGGVVRFERLSNMTRAQEMEQHARAQFQEAAQYAARSEQEGRDRLNQITDLLNR